jgi:hypothetical protein
LGQYHLVIKNKAFSKDLWTNPVPDKVSFSLFSVPIRALKKEKNKIMVVEKGAQATFETTSFRAHISFF